MSTDSNDIPAGLVRTLAMGLETDNPATFEENDLVTRRTDVDSLSGEMPVRGTESLVRRDENRDLGPKGEAKPYDRDLLTFNYDAKRQVGMEYVTNEEVIELDGYNEDAIEEALQGAETQANLNVDLLVEDALLGNRDSSRNTVSAGANWSDETNATPIEDFDKAFDETPGADTIVMGRTAYTELSQLPDVLSNAGRARTEGGASESEVESFLLDRYAVRGLENVHIIRKWYDSANEGQDHSKSWIGDTNCWVYHKDAVQLVDPEHRLNPYVDQEKVPRRSSTELIYERRADCQLTTENKVTEITGI